MTEWYQSDTATIARKPIATLVAVNAKKRNANRFADDRLWDYIGREWSRWARNLTRAQIDEALADPAVRPRRGRRQLPARLWTSDGATLLVFHSD